MAVNTPTALEQVQAEAAKLPAVEAPKQPKLTEMMREAVKRGDAKKAMEDARKNLTVGVDKSVLTQTADNNLFHLDSNLQRGKRNDFINEGERVNKYLTEDYAQLDPNQVTGMRSQVLGEVQSLQFLGELNKSLTSQNARDKFADSILKDPAFRARANRRLHEISTRKITNADKQNKLNELQQTNPNATWEEAAGILEQELQEDMNNVIRDAFRETIKDNLDAAEDITDNKGAELDKALNAAHAQTGEGVISKYAKRWDTKGAYDKRMLFRREPGTITEDFEKFSQGGLEGLFGSPPKTAEEQAILNDPELRKQFESQIGEKLLLKRLRSGKLSEQDFYRMADAGWMGSTPTERTARLTDIVTAHKNIQSLLEDGQRDGWIKDKSGFLNWLKDPKNSAVSMGILAALLAAIAVGPAAAGVAIPAIAAQIGGAGILGASAGGVFSGVVAGAQEG